MDVLAAQPVSRDEQHVSQEMGQTTPTEEEWIQLAIDIQESQFVFLGHQLGSNTK
jgi:hypothetical protein